MNTGLIHGKLKRRKTMVSSQKYGQEFMSKNEFLQWFEKNARKINWDFGFWAEWYNEEDADEGEGI